jgi:foldase protein PrsA
MNISDKQKEESMKRIKSIFVIVMLMTLLTACQNNSNNSEDNSSKNETKYELKGDLSNNSLILSIDDIQVGYDEVSVYMQELKNNYEAKFGDSIWFFDLGKNRTFEDEAKDEIIDQIVQMKIMGLKAADLGVELTQDEKDEIAGEVKEFIESLNDEYIKDHAITEELITRVYSDNYLASKVFDVATNDVDTNISDDEAKQITIWQIFIQTSGEDENGNVVKLSDEEKKTALSKAKKLLKQAKDTDDFYSLAEDNTDDTDVEYTFGKGEKDKKVEEAAFALKTGQLSKVIQGDNGYYIIYCASDYDEEATANRKEEIIADRQDEAFQKLYTEWSKDYKVAVNTSMWDQAFFVEHTDGDEIVTEINGSDNEQDNNTDNTDTTTDLNSNEE